LSPFLFSNQRRSELMKKTVFSITPEHTRQAHCGLCGREDACTPAYLSLKTDEAEMTFRGNLCAICIKKNPAAIAREAVASFGMGKPFAVQKKQPDVCGGTSTCLVPGKALHVPMKHPITAHFIPYGFLDNDSK
jgi:hypothetical protein